VVIDSRTEQPVKTLLLGVIEVSQGFKYKGELFIAGQKLVQEKRGIQERWVYRTKNGQAFHTGCLTVVEPVNLEIHIVD